MCLLVSGTASPVTCGDGRTCLGSGQCSGSQVGQAKHTQFIGHGAVNCCRGLLIAVLREGGWCCWFTRVQQSSLPSLEISSSKDLKWNLPLVFQIFCSRCSSHSAPLPRYGQMKPVRVCTHCYMFHVTPFYSDKAGIWRIKLLVCLLESYTDW